MLAPLKNLWKRGIARLVQRRANKQYRLLLQSLTGRAQSLAANELKGQQVDSDAVFISVITPVYNAPRAYIDDLVKSFVDQNYRHSELILVDDGSSSPETIDTLSSISQNRVRCIRLEQNLGIVAATNKGLSEAVGNWVTFLDHDDAFAPHALHMISLSIQQNNECEFLYTDEVITNRHLVVADIFLKPAFDRVLLSGVNYINHCSVYQTDKVRAIGGFRAGFEGSQDYDLLLRYTSALKDEAIVHLPYPAYLWRRDGQSYSAKHLDRATEAAREALSQVYGGAPVHPSPLLDGLHRVDLASATAFPKVSVIIPNINSPRLLDRVMNGLLGQTDYPDMEIIIVDNGSTDPDTLELYGRYGARGNVIIDIIPEPFNFSRVVNRGAGQATGPLLLLLNNDIELVEPSWLKEMVACLGYEGVGVVGAKLLYPNRCSQHLGVIVGFGNYAGHWYMEQPVDFPGPMGRLAVRQSLSAVTGACLLTTRQCWDDLGGLDEHEFKIAYNDVDYCLRALEKGHKVVWTPFATLIHHESATRGSDETPQNRQRFEQEKANLDRRHHTIGYQDPAINPWYTTDRSYPVPRLLPSLPPARTNRSQARSASR